MGNVLDARDGLPRRAHLRRRERSWTHTAHRSELLLHVTLTAQDTGGSEYCKKKQNNQKNTSARHALQMHAEQPCPSPSTGRCPPGTE